MTDYINNNNNNDNIWMKSDCSKTAIFPKLNIIAQIYGLFILFQLIGRKWIKLSRSAFLKMCSTKREDMIVHYVTVRWNLVLYFQFKRGSLWLKKVENFWSRLYFFNLSSVLAVKNSQDRIFLVD